MTLGLRLGLGSRFWLGGRGARRRAEVSVPRLARGEMMLCACDADEGFRRRNCMRAGERKVGMWWRLDGGYFRCIMRWKFVFLEGDN